jgi:hypothetical protein
MLSVSRESATLGIKRAWSGVSPLQEMPDDRDHRDDEEDVNESSNHREDEKP